MSPSVPSPSVTTDDWPNAASYRRTIYGLKGTSSVPDSRARDIIQKIQVFAPSAYNTQPIRYSLVTGEKHKLFWEIIIQAAEPSIKGTNEAAWKSMQGFLQNHKAAYGSVVVWESLNAQNKGAESHKSAAQMFPQYGDHASGMAQMLLWTALELEGLGANLKHMQSIPQVEVALKEFCGVPEDYSLKAHINYGDKAQPHPEIPLKMPFSEAFDQLG
ncbi:hypothetical protein Brms1b_007735 [Colletotrichum noveboracense]|nr:hypothetical protein COL940_008511 [Colletotrichum noveboracense]KAJ0283499.1 hypothetical protein CBS470a_007313 [Colletotrichum nupharicola]KAJ0312743.1 hypothetical protein Brms1b_007735 [Colletotrichum noveboracense]